MPKQTHQNTSRPADMLKAFQYNLKASNSKDNREEYFSMQQRILEQNIHELKQRRRHSGVSVPLAKSNTASTNTGTNTSNPEKDEIKKLQHNFEQRMQEMQRRPYSGVALSLDELGTASQYNQRDNSMAPQAQALFARPQPVWDQNAPEIIPRRRHPEIGSCPDELRTASQYNDNATLVASTTQAFIARPQFWDQNVPELIPRRRHPGIGSSQIEPASQYNDNAVFMASTTQAFIARPQLSDQNVPEIIPRRRHPGMGSSPDEFETASQYHDSPTFMASTTQAFIARPELWDQNLPEMIQRRRHPGMGSSRQAPPTIRGAPQNTFYPIQSDFISTSTTVMTLQSTLRDRRTNRNRFLRADVAYATTTMSSLNRNVDFPQQHPYTRQGLAPAPHTFPTAWLPPVDGHYMDGTIPVPLELAPQPSHVEYDLTLH